MPTLIVLYFFVYSFLFARPDVHSLKNYGNHDQGREEAETEIDKVSL